MVARPVIHTLAAPALGPAVPDTAGETDLRRLPAVPGAGEGLQGCVPLCGPLLESLVYLCPASLPYQLIRDKGLQMENVLWRIMTEVCENEGWLINL